MRARRSARLRTAQAAVRAGGSKPAAITLGFGVLFGTVGRTICRRPRAIFCWGLRSPQQNLLSTFKGIAYRTG
jgi:hypothetical protein